MIQKYLPYISCVILGFILGFFVCYHWFPRTITQEVPQYITEKIEVPVETKETTGIAVVQPEQQGDVLKVVDRGTQLSAVVNGKEYVIPQQKQDQKVELGKNAEIVVTKESKGQVDLTPIVNQMVNDKLTIEKNKEKHFGIGPHWDNKSGLGLAVSHDNNNRVIVIEGNKKQYGATATFKF